MSSACPFCAYPTARILESRKPSFRRSMPRGGETWRASSSALRLPDIAQSLFLAISTANVIEAAGNRTAGHPRQPSVFAMRRRCLLPLDTIFLAGPVLLTLHRPAGLLLEPAAGRMHTEDTRSPLSVAFETACDALIEGSPHKRQKALQVRPTTRRLTRPQSCGGDRRRRRCSAAADRQHSSTAHALPAHCSCFTLDCASRPAG